MIDINKDAKMKGLKDKLESKGWSRFKIMTFMTKMTSVSMEATNNLCSSCKKLAILAASRQQTQVKYCWTCMKMYEDTMKPLLEELNKK
jgi:hypothetical protein